MTSPYRSLIKLGLRIQQQVFCLGPSLVLRDPLLGFFSFILTQAGLQQLDLAASQGYAGVQGSYTPAKQINNITIHT